MHLHLGLMFPAMAVPAFECTDVGPTCLKLHYHSHRPALGPIVVGVLKGLAEQYWGLGGEQLQVELLRGRDDCGSEDDDHDVFRVRYEPNWKTRLINQALARNAMAGLAQTTCLAEYARA